jgi:hypothetical protein
LSVGRSPGELALGNNLAIRTSGLFGRLDAELPLKDGDTRLVLAQGIAQPALTSVQPHEGPVGFLAQRIQRQEPGSRLNGRLEGI